MSTWPFVAANLAVALALELAAFSAVGYGAFHLAGSIPAGLVLSAAAVIGSTVLWGLFAAPRARHRHPLAVITVKAFVFGGGSAALTLNGHATLGVVLGSVVALNALALNGTRFGYGGGTAHAAKAEHDLDAGLK
jgi:hypothetical protein